MHDNLPLEKSFIVTAQQGYSIVTLISALKHTNQRLGGMASSLRMRKVISPEQNRAVAAIDSRVV